MSTPLAWKTRAACKGAPSEVFITPGDEDDEPSYPSRAARAYCDRCPVKPECLQYATENNAVGVWGGTTAYQRRQLQRERERSKCPGCGSSDIVTEHNVELCMRCGISWRTI
jgi:WhiB family redox-sensing transcriptional regulator